MSLNENKHAIHHSRLYKDWLISCPTAEGILGFLVLRQGHPRNSSFVATRLYHPRNSSKQQSLLTEGHVAINLLVIGLSCLVVSVFFSKKKKVFKAENQPHSFNQIYFHWKMYRSYHLQPAQMMTCTHNNKELQYHWLTTSKFDKQRIATDTPTKGMRLELKANH